MEAEKEDREKFFNRIAFLPEADLMRIQLAYTLSKYAHRAQVRKEPGPDGKPLRYFEHVRRVALVLIDELKIARPELIITALLHDGIEDTRDLTPDMIEFHFGGDVGTLVKLLSKVPKEGYAERLFHFGDWRATVIKACDRLDNLRSLGTASREFRAKQVNETRRVYYAIFNRMVEITPPEHAKAASYLRDEIMKATEAVEL
jgi:guanosine-3',5'-bis(diphosphate) 3'-pyrophosphohydrolase